MGQNTEIIATRLPGWDRRLSALIDSHVQTEYSLESFECSRFCADVMFAITGVDMYEDYRDKFKDEATREELIQSFESKSFFGEADAVFKKYGIFQADWKQLKKGDPCYIEIRDIKALGINIGAHAIVPSKVGFLQIPLNKIKAGWKIT